MGDSLYDADALALAVEAPAVRIGRRTYVGRVLSYPEWLPFRDRLLKLKAQELSDEETLAFFREFLDASFPHPWWRFWEPPPRAVIMRHPQLLAIMHHFFGCQARALTTGLRLATPTPGQS
jgi:hypothetical protein